MRRGGGREDREEGGTEGVAMEAAGEDAADAEVAATVAVGVSSSSGTGSILRPLRIRASSIRGQAEKKKKTEKNK